MPYDEEKDMKILFKYTALIIGFGLCAYLVFSIITVAFISWIFGHG